MSDFKTKTNSRLGLTWQMTCAMQRIFAYCNQFGLLAAGLNFKEQTNVYPIPWIQTQKGDMDKKELCHTHVSRQSLLVWKAYPCLISREKHHDKSLNRFDLCIWWITYPYFWCGHLMCSQTCKWSSRSYHQWMFTELCNNQ